MSTEVRKLDLYKKISDIFERYKDMDRAVFLDSSLKNQLGRYSIVGLHPYLEVKEEQGKCYVNGEEQEISVEKYIEQYLLEHKEENPWNLPMIAGAVGYFSYDFGRKFEKIQTRHKKKVEIPEALFVFYDNYIVEDLEKEELYITARGILKDAQESLDILEKEIGECTEAPVPEKSKKQAPFIPNFEKEEYKQAVDRMIDYIVEGDIYIANMTQQLMVESKKDPYEVFRHLRTYNPSPFGGYFQYGDFQIASASPERFLLVEDGKIETRPIKGTRKRGETKEEDEALRLELQNSSKDRSELLMIVDLERNDLNHVCRPSSVEVTEHFAVEAYATVFHLVTTIVGQMREECGVSDLIRAAFPGGSITGAPKIRAMEIIDELEHDRRGLYTGSIGYFSLDGSCDLNIVIRTAVHKDGKYYLGVGGGITCESDLEFEYEETLQKAKAVLEAISEE